MRPEAVSKDVTVRWRAVGRHAPPSGDASGGGGEGEDLKNKKDLAVRFIRTHPAHGSRQRNALICREAGEDLAQFFMSYSATLIARDPERVLQNTSSLMLMGYLIRTQEERPGGARLRAAPGLRLGRLDRGRWSVLAAGLPGSC